MESLSVVECFLLCNEGVVMLSVTPSFHLSPWPLREDDRKGFTLVFVYKYTFFAATWLVDGGGGDVIIRCR